MKSFLTKWTFPLIWCSITVILYLIILSTSSEIEKWPPFCTADGLQLFVKVFSIPLYFFAAGIPIYGIILTIRRIDQSEKQYSLLMYSSYYKHLDDFINYLKVINETDIRLISGETSENQEVLYRRWHSIWFGNEREFNHNVVESIVEELEELLDNVSNVRTLVNEGADITADSLNIIKQQFDKFGINLSDDTIHTIRHEGVAGQLQSSLKVLINICKFSGSRIIVNEHIQMLID